MDKIILASASPRRKELLKEIVTDFEITHSDIDEELREGESPSPHTRRLAREKAEAALKKFSKGIIIGADTVVVIGNVILGKPVNEEEASEMLQMLSGRTHTVYTSFCVLNAETKAKKVATVSSRVTFRELTEEEILDYIKTGEPMDKAGSYALQGRGQEFVEVVHGSRSNVIGLPIDELKAVLEEMTAT